MSWDTEVLKHKLAASKTVMGSLHQLQPVHDSVSFRIAMSGGPDQNSLTQLSEAARPLDLAIDEATLVLSDDTVALIKTARHSALGGEYRLCLSRKVAREFRMFVTTATSLEESC